MSPLLVVLGETASGKSDLALRLAQRFSGEIICADSWTVRREADIGTAKPSAADQAKIPHHLLDVVGPDDDFTAAVFKEMAQKTIDGIASRGKLPILVGGTGLYIDAVLYDYGFLPAGDRQAREGLNKLSTSELIERIHELGIELGSVDQRNKRRLIRLIEADGEQPSKQPMRQNTLVIGLRIDRDSLKQQITDRTDAMIADGLENEVRRLADRYGWECEALKGVGYAQWQGYFDGTQNLDETRQKIIKATLDLAKRQRTWFKRPAYRDLSEAEQPSSAKFVRSSLAISADMPRSQRPNLTRRSSARHQTSHDKPDARNNSIQWFYAPVNWQSVVDSVATFLNH